MLFRSCPGTSWLVRMRLCEVMGRALAPFRSGPTVSCQVDGTYLDESLAGRRSRSRAVLPRGPRRSAATCASAAYRTPRCACSAGGGDLGDEFCELADRGRPTDEALGLGPAGRGRGHARLDRRPPGPRPGAAEARRVVPRRDARARGPARRARHGGARRARGPRASWRASGGSRRGGSATTSTGSCGTSRRGGRTPTGRTPCRARRRRGATTTRGSPSRGSRSPSGPTGRISWPCRRWSNRELTVYSSLKQQALNTSEAAYRDKLKD